MVNLQLILVILFIILVILNSFHIYQSFKYWKSRDRWKKQKFTFYINLVFYIVLVTVAVLWWFDFLLFYPLIGVVSLYVTSLGYIALVKRIKKKYDKEQDITESQFLGYLIFFSLVLFLYILSFSNFYIHQIPLGKSFDGYFTIKDTSINPSVEMVYPIKFGDSFYYSGYTFFSMEYGDFKARGLLKLIALLELFTAQIAVIIFIGIIAGYALQRLVLND